MYAFIAVILLLFTYVSYSHYSLCSKSTRLHWVC